MNKEEYVNPENCPLCNKPNHCGCLANSSKPCWCMDEEITFPDSLLNQVVDAAKNKACICKPCALKHKNGQ
ncbi:cysteine-rich CWC family protein [Marinobacter sp. ANT_B65]|uniref:cysteine-rich CWC family protein n=1 Tax=Marinobacter sp. ANT_B65 TaxID=2039467 RepID=UPI000BBEC98C|nr:hypothetical protein CPA50_10905 [Marinobacter sp. ANT_B65]